jgi:hypothetical protein
LFSRAVALGLELVEGAPSIGLRLENGGGVLNADAAGMVIAADSSYDLRPASGFVVLLAALDAPRI